MFLTSSETAEKWGISPRRVSLLCSSNRINGAVKKGKTWLIPEETCKPSDSRMKDSEEYCGLSIQNRRYLGNKFKLLDFIEETINQHCPGVDSLFDIFAGTGVVAYHFMNKMQVYTNDILYSNYVAHLAFMSDMHVDMKRIKKQVCFYNSLVASDLDDNYMSENFADTYFSKDDCKVIGFVREHIESSFRNNEINERERAVLITILLYSMDRIANTCGHYDAYRKDVEFEKSISFSLIDLSKKACKKNRFYNEDANELVKHDEIPFVDCVYCDPPYNSRNYCDLYHVLENVAKWDKPVVSGVARKMDRSHLKSKYCGKSAALAFEDLVTNLKCKYIILSYNNTGDNANDRSNARMSDDDIMRILSKKGSVKVYSKKYKSFTTGKSCNENNEERLFVCTVFQQHIINEKNSYIKSPLNYTGGKTRLLSQLLPLFPCNINTFVDLFCGGANVGINVPAKKVLYYDSNKDLLELFELFQKYSIPVLMGKITSLIKEYNLSDSQSNGYHYYKCNSSKGLADYNKDLYVKLREDFNNLHVVNDDYYVMLYVLIIYSFNNQIRFNNSHEFNLPVGKRDFNRHLKNNLDQFVNALHSQNSSFTCSDFRDVDLSSLTSEDFVYCDPPYLISTASYNEANGWTETDEKDLLDLLDTLDKRGIKFALSNVITHKGRRNDVLASWAEKYKIHMLEFNYNNSNYHTKNTDLRTQEVLITNY